MQSLKKWRETILMVIAVTTILLILGPVVPYVVQDVSAAVEENVALQLWWEFDITSSPVTDEDIKKIEAEIVAREENFKNAAAYHDLILTAAQKGNYVESVMSFLTVLHEECKEAERSLYKARRLLKKVKSE